MIVLVIDDEDDIRLLAEMGLAASGLNVVVAAGGAEGLALARTHQPDLIVLDVMMPEMDGYATLEALRREPATAKIPVLMLTAKNLAASDETLRDQGVVDLVPKPFVPREFVARVLAALSALEASAKTTRPGRST
ncbi:MAG: response regulator [Acidobacteriota bacterium]